MKKIVLSENQIKKIVDTLMSEQYYDRTMVKSVQCFLNNTIKSNLTIDGLAGPNSLTEKALKQFQTKKKQEGFDIDIDGVWGYRTQNSLSTEERKMWKLCLQKFNINK